jgi:hypothetical protein
MSAANPVWQGVLARVQQLTARCGLRVTTQRRLALLVTGILLAKSVVLNQVAAELAEARITTARTDSIARRLRRTLAAPVPAADLYRPAVVAALGWQAAPPGAVELILDESSQDERVHLLRLSLAYRGGAVALAWQLWPQNTRLPDGAYWQALDQVLATAAALLPTEPRPSVTLLADRAYDIPPLVDRLTARGWSYVVRLKLGSVVWCDHQGRQQPLRQLIARHVQRPGQRWKGRGQLFKQAGWRTLSVVAYWQPGEDERLVVLTDQPPAWAVLSQYGRRFWCEAAFRTDKSAGWQWEQSQVRGLHHHTQLLLAMAWASLIAVCLGVVAAAEELTHLAARRPRPGRRLGRPRHARASLFTLGLRRLRGWLYRTRRGPLPWRLPAPTARSWFREWHAAQSQQLLRQSVRP